MGKYTDVVQGIMSVFATTGWTNEGIKTYPDNFTSQTGDTEFIRVSIITPKAGVESYSSMINNVKGLLMIAIFVPAENGQKRPFVIADKLDIVLAGKTLTPSSNFGKLQFGSSTLSGGKTDPANSSLYRMDYSIPFDYFSN